MTDGHRTGLQYLANSNSSFKEAAIAALAEIDRLKAENEQKTKLGATWAKSCDWWSATCSRKDAEIDQLKEKYSADNQASAQTIANQRVEIGEQNAAIDNLLAKNKRLTDEIGQLVGGEAMKPKPMPLDKAVEILNEHRYQGSSQWYVSNRVDGSYVVGPLFRWISASQAVKVAEGLLANPGAAKTENEHVALKARLDVTKFQVRLDAVEHKLESVQAALS